MIRAILFDFEGTLVDFVAPLDAKRLFREGATRCFAFLSAHELALPSFNTFHRQQKWIHLKAEFLRRLNGAEPDMRPVLRRLCSDYRLQRDQASLATLAWRWYEPRAEQMRIADDVIPTLTALADAQIELGLVVNTQWQGEVIDEHLERLGLMEFFPFRTYSTEVGVRMPEPPIYRAALESMDVDVSDAMFVGSQPKIDIAGAKQIGMTTVLRRNDHRGSASADHVIRNIGDLLKLPGFRHIRPRTRPIAAPMPQLVI